jgi:hypothetical protein
MNDSHARYPQRPARIGPRPSADPGRNGDTSPGWRHPQSPPDLVRHVAHSTGLDEATASRVVADVVAYFGQTVEEYVRQRHAHLKSRNRKNDDIWPLILDELTYRRFKADELTPRQLRRIVYG